MVIVTDRVGEPSLVELVVEVGMLNEEPFVLFLVADLSELLFVLDVEGVLLYFHLSLFLLYALDLLAERLLFLQSYHARALIFHVSCEDIVGLGLNNLDGALLEDEAALVEVVLVGFQLALTLLVELKVAFQGVEGRRHLIERAQLLRVLIELWIHLE
eukprot:CAMPEP_0170543240 /NCGR_PEP_ID=MMETSP0211-20121228/2419_1 /TAXON_ID=311385 /ORGANISM="Pseudokeronopsis sp., Strain OXSARD2" /LENGTH=157 /DNA_ID=CAMNT_0010846563 /DNA_START=1701 /DNA_END=2174 /DNA_ORIENTATION=-